jgi:hypothetical protein
MNTQFCNVVEKLIESILLVESKEKIFHCQNVQNN